MIKKLLLFVAFISLTATSYSQSLGNNTCATAVTLTVNAACTSGNNTTATATGDPAASCFTVENGIWFKFVAPTFGTYVTISTDFGSTNFDTQLALYSGACGSLTQIGCDDDGGTGTNSVLTSTCLTPGQTYYVMLDGYAGDIGTFCINVTAPNIPHNDWCSCANTLLLNGTCQNGTTINADNDVTSAVGCQSTGANGEVWYTFVADSTRVTFNITSSTIGNIEFNLLRGSCSALTGVATVCSASPLNYTATNLTIGATYYVMVSSLNSNQGNFQICATSSTPPTVPGQDCPTAAILCNSNSFSQPTSNAGFGTQEVSTANSCWGSGGERQSRWYKFTVGCSGTLTFNITPVNNNDDYDWAIWNITTAGCPTTAATTNDPVACNWYGLTGVNGSTGLSANPSMACTNENAVDYTPGPSCDPYAFYNQSAGNYNALNVTAGSTYAILIDNFTTSNSGFTITFGGTAVIGPSATFTISNPTCTRTITPTKTCTTSNSTYLWSFGDGTTSTLQAPGAYTYAADGTYIVSLTVTDALGCSRTTTQTITIVSAPPAPTIVGTTICSGTTASLTPTGPGGTYAWYTASSGGTLLFTGPTYTTPSLSATTTYYVQTTVNGCTSTRSPVTVTVNPAAVANAGADATTCGSGSYTLAGSIGGSATTLTWTTSGTGTFGNNTIANTTYTPSAADASAGSVTLTLTTNDPAGVCPAVTDVMVLTFNTPATANAGADATICSGSTHTLAGSIGGSATSLTWTTSGTGSFSNATSATATYTPSAADISAGSVTLTLTTNDPAGPCPSASDFMVLTITPPATANAGADAIICSGSTYTLSGSIGGSATSLTWTTSGSGSFSSSTSATATYTPSAADIIAGSVTLTLTTNDPPGSCPAVSDAMVLTINPRPTANAGIDATICSGSTYTLGGSIGGGATSLTWTTSGSGTFSNATSATATYTPSAADITAGSVTLTLTTNDPAGPCPSVSDAMVLTINTAATANAGTDVTICAGSTYTLSGAIGGGATSLTWTTSGSGSFSSSTSATATYTPSAADITAGSVTLTLTTNDPAGPCPPASDAMVITINPAATANAGIDATICANNTHTLTGSIGGSATSLTWSTSGTGTFSSTTTASSTYTPSAADIAAGSVTITITTNDPAGPCPPRTDQMVLTITPRDNASFSYASSTYCQTGTNPSPTITGLAGGTFTSAPAGLSINSATGLINLTASTIGTYTVTYTTNGPCPNTATYNVTITTAPNASFSYSGPYCQSGSNPVPTFPAGASAGTFSATPAGLVFVSTTTGQINLSASTSGTYTVTNSIAAGGGCSATSSTANVTINQSATANAGADATICGGSTHTLAGSVGGSATTLTWSTSGTGTFNNTSLGGAVYTPSAADITAGTVTLTITSNDPAGPCPSATDAMVLTINPAATANAGADAIICSGNTYTLNGTVGGGASTLTWTTSGTGTFSNSSSGSSTYTPSASDISAGSVTITLTTNDPAGPCGPVSDAMILTINPAATANAGIDMTICSGSTAALTGTIGGGATSVTWTTSGSGTFSNANSLTPTYTPSASDISAGIITLTMTTNDPAGPCIAASDNLVLTINQAATANAGADATICSGATYTLSGSIGGSATTLTWTTSGTGTFSSTSSATATYTPSAADISGGTVTLTLTTNDPAGPCPSVTDAMVLTINPAATANAGLDAAICAGGTYTLAGSIGGGATTVTWSTSGTGTFSSTTSTTPVYTPSAADISAGVVTLSMTTNDPAGPCGAATDNMILTINQAAIVNAGADATICSGSTYTLTGSMGGSATSITWTTSGSGTFSSTSSASATYTPSAADITGGTVTLTITSNDPAGPCNAVTDNMILTINQPATLNAGADAVICEGTTYTAGATLGGSATSVTWTTTGTGTFSSTTSLTPVYTPSGADISAGSVILTATSNDPAGPCPSVNDNLLLTINPSASVNAGADATICAGSPYTLAGSIGGSATTMNWTTSGSGTFSSATSSTATYTPSAADISAGSVTLTLTTNDPAGPCPSMSDAMVLTISTAPTVDAGANASVCAGATYTLNGSMGGSATSVTWSSNGTGTFSSSSTISTVYTPSAADISSGSVTITVTTNDPAGPCTAVTDNMILTITPLDNATFNYSSSTYCVTGTDPTPTITGLAGGSFSATPAGLSITSATGLIDLSASTVGTYNVTYSTNGTCPNTFVSSITITNAPSASFSYTGPYCQSGTNPLPTFPAGSSAGTFSSTVGLVFSNTSTGELNLSASTPGTYTVTNSIAPAGGCAAASATANVTIETPATVNSGANQTICAGSTVSLNGTIGGSATSMTWTSSGTGSFSSTTSGVSTYTPSAADISAGSVTITLTTDDPAGSCPSVNDPLTVSINQAAATSAGSDVTICSGSTVALTGSFSGSASSVTWSTTGSGTFFPTTGISSTYTPSAADITAGSVVITITTNDPAGPCPSATDNMIITINAPATVNAGADVTVCEGSTATLAGTMGGSAASVTWTTSGTGTFSSATSLTPTYTPSAADITAGTVTLTITTDDPTGPCPSVTDNLVLTIDPAATVFAGSDAIICEGDVVNLTGTTGGSATSVTWTTSGTGIFSSATTASTTYTPSAADNTAGSVTLTLTTNDPAGACSAVTDQMLVTINDIPVADAGLNNTICAGSTFTVSGSISGGATSSTWTTSGSGTFANASATSTTYTPSAADITAGSVVLTITTDDPAGPCVAATDNMTLTINQPAQVNAGINDVICQGSTYTLSGTMNGSASSVNWTTSGSGTFSSSTSLSATYTPSAADITAGSVYLIITTNDPSGPCPAVIDTMQLNINTAAVVFSGNDTAICAGNSISLTGSMAGATSTVTWSTSGTGSFSSGTNLSTNYTPSANDITSGVVTLTLSSDDPAGPCPIVTDNLVLTINPLDNATFSYSPSTFCQTGTDPTPSITLPGGVFTASPAGVTLNSSSGEITLGSSTVGSYTITYTTAGICPNNSSMVVTITNAPSAAFSYDSTYCQSSGTVTPSFPVGSSAGTFSATPAGLVFANSSTGAIDLTASTPGTYFISNDIPPMGDCAAATFADTVTIDAPAIANAGAATDSVCSGSVFTLNGSVTGVTGGTWSTLGDGTFGNTTSLTSTYTPGVTDSTNGVVQIVLTSDDPAGVCPMVTDTLGLVITAPATANAGMNDTICIGGTYTLNGQVTVASGGTWTTLGDGTFDNATSLGAVYTPGSGDNTAGIVTLVLTSTDPVGPCNAVTDTVTITINALPLVNAGADAGICKGSAFPLSGTITGAGMGLWSTTGDGTFDNSSSLTPVYTPGTADTTAGTVNLVLTSSDPAGPCGAVTDTLVLTINPDALANAGTDIASCSGSPVTLNGFVSGAASTLTWTSSGTGTFNNATSGGATYTPSATDVLAGSISLIITTDDPAGNCVAAVDSVNVVFEQPATVSVGNDTITCGTSSITLNGIVGGTGTTITSWTSSGTGVFSPASGTSTSYTPSAADTAAGSVLISVMTDDPTNSCGAVADTLILSFSLPAVANAGADTAICEGSTLTLNGLVSGSATSGSWTTSGTGTFDNQSILNATNTPSSADISNGAVSLVLMTDDPSGVCGSVVDTLIVSFNTAPTLSLGNDTTICGTSAVTLTATLGGSATSVTSWSTSGTGTFASATGTANSYTPSAADLTLSSITIVAITDDPAGACGSSSDTLLISFMAPPTVTAGADTVICGGSNYTLTGVLGGSATTATWTSSGTGTFDNAGSLTAIYTPSLADILAGAVTLTLTSDPSTGCGTASDQVTVTFSQFGVANAGADTTIVSCLSPTYTLPGSTTVTGSSIVYNWSTTNGAIVSGGNTLNPVVNQSGTYLLTVTDTSTGCTITDQVTVTFDTNTATANASASPLTGIAPLTVNFTSDPASTYLWNFGDTAATNSVLQNPVYTYTEAGTYNVMLTITATNGCTAIDTLSIEVIGKSVFTVPNVFSPNEDGNNDIFNVFSVHLKTLHGQIYNRWGEKIFEWNTVEGGWDGYTNSGVKAVHGTYLFIIEATGFDGEEYFEKGFVTLVR